MTGRRHNALLHGVGFRPTWAWLWSAAPRLAYSELQYAFTIQGKSMMERLISVATILAVLAVSGCASSEQPVPNDGRGAAVSGPYVGGGGGVGLR